MCSLCKIVLVGSLSLFHPNHSISFNPHYGSGTMLKQSSKNAYQSHARDLKQLLKNDQLLSQPINLQRIIHGHIHKQNFDRHQQQVISLQITVTSRNSFSIGNLCIKFLISCWTYTNEIFYLTLLIERYLFYHGECSVCVQQRLQGYQPSLQRNLLFVWLSCR